MSDLGAPRQNSRKSKLREESEIAGDQSIDAYTKAQLLEMDRKFCEAMERALSAEGGEKELAEWLDGTPARKANGRG
jgi:hypothetical protein